MKSFRINRIIFSVGAIVLGIILLIWPATSLMVMGKCVGVFLALGGFAAGFMFFRDHETAMKSILLVMAAVMLICGVVIFMHPDELVKLIPTIMGILVVISGLINLGETFVLSRSKYGRWWVSLIIAIITIAAGIFIINKAFSLAEFITRIAGGVLIFDGITDLWVVSRLYKASKDAEVEVTAVEVDVKPGAAEAGESESAAAPQNAATGEQSAPENAETASHQSAPVESYQNAGQTAEGAGSAPGNDNTAVPEYMNQTEQETDYSGYGDIKLSDDEIVTGEWKPVDQSDSE